MSQKENAQKIKEMEAQIKALRTQVKAEKVQTKPVFEVKVIENEDGTKKRLLQYNYGKPLFFSKAKGEHLLANAKELQKALRELAID